MKSVHYIIGDKYSDVDIEIYRLIYTRTYEIVYDAVRAHFTSRQSIL